MTVCVTFASSISLNLLRAFLYNQVHDVSLESYVSLCLAVCRLSPLRGWMCFSFGIENVFYPCLPGLRDEVRDHTAELGQHVSLDVRLCLGVRVARTTVLADLFGNETQ